MLDELNEDTDKASESLQAVTKKTKELIEQSGALRTLCGPGCGRLWTLTVDVDCGRPQAA